MGKDLQGNELGKGFRQRKDRTYSARYVDRFGKRQELYNKDLTALHAEYDKAIEEDKNETGIIIDYTMNLSKWFSLWIEIHKYKVIRNTTISNYTRTFENHIKPVLGRKKLKEITQLEIKSLLRRLDLNGFGFETKNRVRILLLDMFNKAMIDNYVERNPCQGIKLERNEKKDIRVLTIDEQTDFFDCCKGTFYDNLYVVIVTTGLRIGEVCALEPEDLDFKKRQINVDKTLIYAKLDDDTQKTFHVNPPKTYTSERIIPMSRQCELALKKQLIQRNNIMSKSSAKPHKGFENLLFTTKFGTPLCDQVVIQNIHKLVDEINLIRSEIEQLEYFSPHCLRHTFATRCFEADIPPKTVQKYLGHATLQMTMDLYTHVLETKKQEDMIKLENRLDAIANASETMIEERYNNMLEEQNNVIYLYQKMG